MTRCALCHDQVKRDEDDVRLAFEFTPEQLVQAAVHHRCDSCLVILEGLRQSETADWSFHCDVRRVYATCHGKRGPLQDTLRLEIYYIDDRPKIELEYFSLQPHRKLVVQYNHDKADMRQRGRVSCRGRRSVVTHSRHRQCTGFSLYWNNAMKRIYPVDKLRNRYYRNE
jgi:hypothetical protein